MLLRLGPPMQWLPLLARRSAASPRSCQYAGGAKGSRRPLREQSSRTVTSSLAIRLPRVAAGATRHATPMAADWTSLLSGETYRSARPGRPEGRSPIIGSAVDSETGGRHEDDN